MLAELTVAPPAALPASPAGSPELSSPVGCVVPHAGWVYSGAVAGHVLARVASKLAPSTVVLFGADHWGEARRRAQVYPDGVWASPLGDAAIDADLAASICGEAGDLVESRASAHRREHSIEVQVPLVQWLWPSAKIVPLLVSPGDDAPELGRRVARAVEGRSDVLALGSSDLTHYGPGYEFTPRGGGRQALEWVKSANDAAIIQVMTSMRTDEVVPESERHRNACGAGAIAAVIAFSRARGAERGELVEYTTSHDVRPRGEPVDFVGYAGVVFLA